ncbi:MAG: hypothetical protein JWN46_1501 [Acidimicrobiales bacterium]|nr:hypothetical protein [Acidimicrobiales bacterium]
MTATGLSSFDATVQKTNEILHAIADANGWPREPHNRPYDAMRTVLHAVRDRLTVNESAHVAAQLPVLVRGVFYEDWVPARVPIKMHRDDLLDRVTAELPFEVETGIEPLVTSVLQALRRFVSPGEWADIAATMPKDLVPLLPV